MTQNEIVLLFIHHTGRISGWLDVPSYDLVRTQTAYGYIGSNGARRARELVEKGLLSVGYEMLGDPPRRTAVYRTTPSGEEAAGRIIEQEKGRWAA